MFLVVLNLILDLKIQLHELEPAKATTKVRVTTRAVRALYLTGGGPRELCTTRSIGVLYYYEIRSHFRKYKILN